MLVFSRRTVFSLRICCTVLWYWNITLGSAAKEQSRSGKNSVLNDSRRISCIFLLLLSESKKWSRPKTRLNVEDLDLGPAMHLAASLGLMDIVSQLLEDGAKADIED